MRCRPNIRRKSGCSPRDPCPAKTLRGLISHFRRGHLNDLRKSLEDFSGLSLDQAIRHASMAEDAEGRRNPHHYRRTQTTLCKAQRKLMRADDKLRACRSFAEILSVVERATSSIEWLGPLFKYDCALSIGAAKGKLPEHIYLHSGTREGAKALGLKWREKFIRVPLELRTLRPHELEDFLCIYSHCFNQRMLKKTA